MPSGPPRPREGSKSQQRIGELLVEMGFITPEQLATALGKQRQWGKRLGYVLVQSGYITESRLVRALARQLRIETCDPIGAPIHDRVRALIPRELALELHVVPLALQRSAEGEHLLVATSDPLNHTARELLQEKSGLSVVWLLAGETEIDLALARHDGTRAPSVLTGSSEPAGRGPMSQRNPSGMAITPVNPSRTPSASSFPAIDVTPPPPSRSVVPNTAPIELDASALEELPEEIAIADPDPSSPRGYDLPDATMEMLDRKRGDSTPSALEAMEAARLMEAFVDNSGVNAESLMLLDPAGAAPARGPDDEEAALDSWLAEEVALGGLEIAVDAPPPAPSAPHVAARPTPPSRPGSTASSTLTAGTAGISGLPLQRPPTLPGRATPMPSSPTVPGPGRATPMPSSPSVPAPGRATPMPSSAAAPPQRGRATPMPGSGSAAPAPAPPPGRSASSASSASNPAPRAAARPTPVEAIARPPPALTPVPGPLPQASAPAQNAPIVRAQLPQAPPLDDGAMSSFGSWADLLPGGGPTGDLVSPSGALRGPRVPSGPAAPSFEARLPRASLDVPSVSIDIDMPDTEPELTAPGDRVDPMDVDLSEADVEPPDTPRMIVKPTSPFPIEPGAAAEPNLRGLPPAPLRLSDAPVGQPTPWTNEPPLLIGSPRSSDAPAAGDGVAIPHRTNGRAGGTASAPAPVSAPSVAISAAATQPAARAGQSAAAPALRPSAPAPARGGSPSKPASVPPRGSVPPNGPVEPRRVAAAKARAAMLRLVASGTVDEVSQRWLMRVMAALIIEHGMLDDEHFERAVAMVGEEPQK